MENLNSDVVFKILDHLALKDLLSFSHVNQMSRQKVNEYVIHQLNNKDVGLKAILLDLDTVPKENWTRAEYRLKVEEKRNKRVPMDLLTGIKKLTILQEIVQARKALVHQKLPHEIHFNSELITQLPLHLVVKRVTCKGLARQVIQVYDRFKLEKSMGQITPGEYVFSLDVKCDPKTEFITPTFITPVAKIGVKIRGQDAALLQEKAWTINLSEMAKYTGPTTNVKRMHKNWFKISTNLVVNTTGTVIYSVLFNTRMNRRAIYIDAITISRV